MGRTFAFVICCWIVFTWSTEANHVLSASESRILQSWVSAQTGLRTAADADCGCPEDIIQMRGGFGGAWAPVPDYRPYVAGGDFNGDGERDFAVVVVDRTRSPDRSFALVVFNGPFRSAKVSPAIVLRDLDMRRKGLFFGPPRPKPYRLVVGAFESEGQFLNRLARRIACGTEVVPDARAV